MDYKTAVLEGCKLFPMQTFGAWFGNHAERACVNGAALGGLLNDKTAAWVTRNPYGTIRDAFPVLSTLTLCPALSAACGFSKRHHLVLDITVHLNDHHYWSREKIADWVDEL